ncbi:MAG TPA: DUF1924 domain-containing protein [Rhodocyclaceae bacterium]|nr:DUF1924 domain-containing protein [Rhodocyclaceae bacterium]
MRYPITIISILLTHSALAQTPRDFLTRFEQEAGKSASAARGAQFFKARHGNDWSCSTCHGERPVQTGKHASTQKPIMPLAPSANAERFTDAAKVDKWFRRNCNDVVGRVCNAQEKADVLAWLLTQTS